jgi:drug/metabolite transporter (DMT)-like permease
MLLVVTLLWGVSFPLSKHWLNIAHETACPGGELGAGLTLLALRMSLALGVIALFQSHLVTGPTWREHGIGLLLGVTNFAGLALQLWGLAETTPALSAFFTALASAWVPLLALACFRMPVARLTLLGLGLAIGGAAVLAGVERQANWALARGDQFTLLSSLVFAVLVVMLDRLGRTVRPGHLTVGLLSGTGLPALVLMTMWAAGWPEGHAWFGWTAGMLQDWLVLRDVALLTFLCTVLSFRWMTTYQPRVPASRAALIYLLEPVFASTFSILWQFDVLTARLLAGGALILGGNLLVELPIWLRSRYT